MRNNSNQIQNIDLPSLRDTDEIIRDMPLWWKWLVISFVLLTFSGVLFLLITGGKNINIPLSNNNQNQLIPSIPVSIDEPGQTTPSASEEMRATWSRAIEKLEKIDPQQEPLQPPLIKLELGL